MLSNIIRDAPITRTSEIALKRKLKLIEDARTDKIQLLRTHLNASPEGDLDFILEFPNPG